MSTAPSNIRVFIDWVESTVFAGEEVKCKITFKNVAVIPVAPAASVLSSPTDNDLISTEKLLKIPSPHSRNVSVRSIPPARSHRTTLSLSSPTNSGLLQNRNSSSHGSSKVATEGNSHRRSVSIISLGTAEGGAESRRASRGHGRSASIQITPRKQVNQRLQLFSPSNGANFVSSPEDKSPQHQIESNQFPNPARTPNTWNSERITSPFPPTFVFPPALKSPHRSRAIRPESEDSSSSHWRSTDNLSVNYNHNISPMEAASPGNTKTPLYNEQEVKSPRWNLRDSIDSEYRTIQESRSRLDSDSLLAMQQKRTETLMMGYAQLHGSFTLDSSLVNQTPFDGVKRKGVIGGQGGGVVGVQASKRENRLRGFGWANIGESIGDFLGSNELSSIKDLKGIVDSGPIPLLSTPQSILFVNLCLGPGESRSYMYSFKVPHGLPPSHRGKAIKINYKLVIGTQRPGAAQKQQVKAVEIPFRVLGSVGNHGELLSHDLMSPYIILQDKASIRPISDLNQESPIVRKVPKASDSNLKHFLSFVDQLLTKPQQAEPPSPSEASSLRSLQPEKPVSTKQIIDLAILRSKISHTSQQSTNKFEIARSGKRVAVLILARSSYRLGETIIAAIDFSDAKIPCYVILAALESSERVDASISLRSESNVFRLTRKIHVSHSESTFFSNRLMFTPTLPLSATPEFITSGVSLDWRIRIEFVTPRLDPNKKITEDYPSLLEELSSDDRGIVLTATESLECESFEIAVPIRVYGSGGHAKEDPTLAKGILV
ncbi:hypothetical protein K3495_g3646 [Podosphaera aphanis]|nr:hypothetical protein K3495_g3646 [Podosphaera aphanis]